MGVSHASLNSPATMWGHDSPPGVCLELLVGACYRVQKSSFVKRRFSPLNTQLSVRDRPPSPTPQGSQIPHASCIPRNNSKTMKANASGKTAPRTSSSRVEQEKFSRSTAGTSAGTQQMPCVVKRAQYSTINTGRWMWRCLSTLSLSTRSSSPNSAMTCSALSVYRM